MRGPQGETIDSRAAPSFADLYRETVQDVYAYVATLLGDRAWWIPRWLDRILPDVDVEGASLERSHPHPMHRTSADPDEGVPSEGEPAHRA